MAAAAFLHDHILSQIEMVDPSRAPLPLHPPSQLPRTPPPPGSLLPVLMHPIPVSLDKSKTVSVDFSLHSHLAKGALGCFHPCAFPIPPHILLIYGRHALHPVNKR